MMMDYEFVLKTAEFKEALSRINAEEGIMQRKFWSLAELF